MGLISFYSSVGCILNISIMAPIVGASKCNLQI
uniref:Uncharacterized protein n=1 Tax=Salmonella phage PMBT18 TaxID=3229742 RepID=A0AB39C265_9CAUD